MIIIKLQNLRSFGNNRYFPKCAISIMILNLMHRMTFKDKDLEEMRKVGWYIDILEEE